MRASLTDNNAVRFGFGQVKFGSYLCTVPDRQQRSMDDHTGHTERLWITCDSLKTDDSSAERPFIKMLSCGTVVIDKWRDLYGNEHGKIQ